LAFAAAIRAARVEAGRAQADTADRAALQVRVLQRAERGQRRFNLGEAAAIAQALGRSPDELVRVSETAKFEAPNIGRPRRAVSTQSAGSTDSFATRGGCAALPLPNRVEPS
jgi:transcriptional regulator with XRE-family HTH domain